MSSSFALPLMAHYVHTGGLILARISGAFLLAPVFSAHTVPLRIRSALTLLLSLILTLHSQGTSDDLSLLELLLAAAGEVLMGLGVGLMFRFVLLCAEFAGELAGMQMGFAFARLADPLTQESTDVTAQLLSAFSLLLLLVADAHRMTIAALARSLQLVPAGQALEHLSVASSWGVMLSTVMSTGLRLAAPVVVALLLSNVALALLARATPQLNLFMLGFGVSIVVGLVALGVIATSGITLLLHELDAVTGRIATLFGV